MCRTWIPCLEGVSTSPCGDLSETMADWIILSILSGVGMCYLERMYVVLKLTVSLIKNH